MCCSMLRQIAEALCGGNPYAPFPSAVPSSAEALLKPLQLPQRCDCFPQAQPQAAASDPNLPVPPRQGPLPAALQ